MPIVNSQTIVDTHNQTNGSRYVIEYHTDDTGSIHQVGPYLAPAGFNIATRLANRAVEMSSQMAEIEAEFILRQS